jgi:putative ABC transport system substrate-binding protein
MNRRTFIAAFGGAAAWPVLARGQQPAMPVIGYLGLTSAQAEAYPLASFHRGLSEAGFDEGRNVTIDRLFAESDVSRLPVLADELVRRKVMVAFTGTTVATLAIKAATSTIPVVFVIGSDPVNLGLVASLNHPGGNLTGVSFLIMQVEAKRLGLLHEFAPKADLIGVLLNANNPFFENQSHELNEASRELSLKIQIEPASNERDIATAFAAFARQHAGAVLVGTDPYFYFQRALVVDTAVRLQIPAIYGQREFVEAGGLMSYGTSLTEAFRQAGGFVARILKGANPADLPVEQSIKFEFLINRKTANALGLQIPPTLLARATEVIE